MKRKLFIGSSLEGLNIAKRLKEKVDDECGDWINSVIWNEGGVFTMNKNALDSLVSASRKFDYGILVATRDDIVKSRIFIKRAPRDNVMFEMGMFLGSLGLTRAFMLLEKKNKLPTDYNGVTVPYFDKHVRGSLEKAIDKVILAFKTTQFTYNIKPIPSTALAVGYFDNFIQKLAIKRQKQNIDFTLDILIPKSLKNIQEEIISYKNNNPSDEISVYENSKRPSVYELISKKNQYWDVPTTLFTLDRLMDIILPSPEVGINKEKQDWIEHELINFSGTIETLVKQCVACRGKVNVLRLP